MLGLIPSACSILQPPLPVVRHIVSVLFAQGRNWNCLAKIHRLPCCRILQVEESSFGQIGRSSLDGGLAKPGCELVQFVARAWWYRKVDHSLYSYSSRFHAPFACLSWSVKAELCRVSYSGATPLHIACQMGDFELALTIYSTAPILTCSLQTVKALFLIPASLPILCPLQPYLQFCPNSLNSHFDRFCCFGHQHPFLRFSSDPLHLAVIAGNFSTILSLLKAAPSPSCRSNGRYLWILRAPAETKKSSIC